MAMAHRASTAGWSAPGYVVVMALVAITTLGIPSAAVARGYAGALREPHAIRSTGSAAFPRAAALVQRRLSRIPQLGAQPRIEDPPLWFSTPENLSDSPALDEQPVIAEDGAGHIFVMWENYSDDVLMFSRSLDGGTSFSSPIAMITGDPFLSFGQTHVVSPGAGDLRMVFTIFDLLSGGAEIGFVALADAGDTLVTLASVSPMDEFNSYAPALAGGWTTALGWSDIDLWTGRTAIQVVRTDDAGVTFTEPKRVDHSNGSACCPSIALPADQNVFVAWREKPDPFATDDGFEVLYSRSLDGGTTFSTPQNLSGTEQESFAPEVVADQDGNLYVLWVDGTYLADLKLLLAISRDHGATFEEPLLLAGPTSDVVGTVAVARDGTVWVAWVEWDDLGGRGNWLVRSLDAGRTFSIPMMLPGDCGVSASCSHALAAPSRDEVFEVYGPGGDSSDVFFTHGVATALCGDANGDGLVNATDALAILVASVGSAGCDLWRCDVDDNGMVRATDALLVLRVAVGGQVELTCPQAPAMEAWP